MAKKEEKLKKFKQKFVPVVDKDQNPLMPTTFWRAKQWIKSRKATYFWKKGIFCVRLNQEPSARNLQEIDVSVDPGSKKEGFTVKSEAHTYLNVQTDAVTHVKEAVKTRREARNNRRQRKAPYRANRQNRACLRKEGRIPPSTRARWQWKLRILNWLNKLFPVKYTVVEDVSAESKKGCKKWNQSFSPLQVGKNWFYSQIPNLITKQGWETKALRDKFGLKKSKNKLSNNFDAHCVDSWVLANDVVGGHTKPDNEEILLVEPLRFHRRQLHDFLPKKGNRRRKGGTISLGLKRGSLVQHKTWRLTYVGGCSKKGLSLHDINTKERIFRTAKVEDCKFLCYNSWICKNI